MEGKKQSQEKLSYAELQKIAGDLSQQNQQLVHRIQQMQSALESQDFNYTSFFISMLFKVIEHPEMYTDNFVHWSSEKIEEILTSFASSADQKSDKEKTDEAE